MELRHGDLVTSKQKIHGWKNPRDGGFAKIEVIVPTRLYMVLGLEWEPAQYVCLLSSATGKIMWAELRDIKKL